MCFTKITVVPSPQFFRHGRTHCMSAAPALRKVLEHLGQEIFSFQQKNEETIHVDVPWCGMFNELPLGNGKAVLRAVRKSRSHRDDSLKTSTDRSIHSKLLIDVAVSCHYLDKDPFPKEDDILGGEHSKTSSQTSCFPISDRSDSEFHIKRRTSARIA